MIKACHLHHQIGGRGLQKAVILAAIRELNDMAQEEIVRVAPTVILESGNMSDAPGNPIYCEHQVLSLPGPGLRYTAIDIAQAPDTRPLSWDAFDMVVYFAAQCTNLEGYQGNDKQAQLRLANRRADGAQNSVLDEARQRMGALTVG